MPKTAILWAKRTLGIAPVDVELMSPLPLNECIARLQAAITPFTASFVAGPVLGEITGTRLRAQKQIFGWRVITRLEANLIDDDERTRLSCRFTMQWGGVAVTVFSPITIVLLKFATDRSYETMFLLINLLIFSIIGCAGLYLANKDRRFLTDFFQQVLDARVPLSSQHRAVLAAMVGRAGITSSDHS